MYAVTINRGGEPTIEDCNQWFIDQLGYDRNEVIGEPLSEFYTSDSAAALLEGGGYDRALSGEFTTDQRDFITADGEILQTMLRAVPRADQEGNVIGTLTLFVELSGGVAM